ncbi:hypothetical protein A6V27_11150 [Hafnia alvei]|nr:hypothetical protein A6V27_11150 [Hafnia alvei]
MGKASLALLKTKNVFNSVIIGMINQCGQYGVFALITQFLALLKFKEMFTSLILHRLSLLHISFGYFKYLFVISFGQS